MEVMKTERLVLRTLVLDDIDSLMTIWGDEDVMKYCGGAGSKQREFKALQYYITMQNGVGFAPYLVLLKDTDEVIGVCGFNPSNHEFDAELMYHFAKKFWGFGYATEAAKGCLEYAKENLGLKSIGASIDVKNHASKKILERLGFNYVGLKWCKATNQDESYYITRL
jgi:[ribosomal protein S5]-alanine N-acetyltransferase